MFCPSCGAEYTIELKYCNRCGANLSTSPAPHVEPVAVNVTKPIVIVGAIITLVTLGGFGGLIGSLTALAPILHGNDPIIAIIFMGMLTILVVDIFLIRILSKLITAALSSGTQSRIQPNPSGGLPTQFKTPTTTSRLQSMPSVTENTTRFFEPYRAPDQTENPTPVEKRR